MSAGNAMKDAFRTLNVVKDAFMALGPAGGELHQ